MLLWQLYVRNDLIKHYTLLLCQEICGHLVTIIYSSQLVTMVTLKAPLLLYIAICCYGNSVSNINRISLHTVTHCVD